MLGRLSADPGTAQRFQAAYGHGPDRASLLEAIASYERSLLTPGSRFDRWLDGDATALTEEERKGYGLFKSLRCVSCHQGVNVGSNLLERHGIFHPLAAPDPAIDTLRQRGARPLPPPLEKAPDPARDVCWRAGDGGSAVLRQLDMLASQVIPTEDAERQNWIARAPRYLPRALRLERRVAMSEEECAMFLAEVAERGKQKALAAPVIVLAEGQDYSIGE